MITDDSCYYCNTPLDDISFVIVAGLDPLPVKLCVECNTKRRNGEEIVDTPLIVERKG